MKITKICEMKTAEDIKAWECNDPECCVCGRGDYLILFDMEKYPVMTDALNAGYKVVESCPELPAQVKQLGGANP